MAQTAVQVYPDGTIETLSFRLRLKAVDFLGDALQNLDQLWVAAVPQGAGSYLPMPKDQDRTVVWSDGVDDALRVIRAFGKFEAIAYHVGGSREVFDRVPVVAVG